MLSLQDSCVDHKIRYVYLVYVILRLTSRRISNRAYPVRASSADIFLWWTLHDAWKSCNHLSEVVQQARCDFS